MRYFIDFEASSLLPSSFPVEVAWVDQNGQGEHYLIRPHTKWLAGGCPGWSDKSEAVHGISLDTLLSDGTPVGRVAARAAKVLFDPGAIAFSDAPGWDNRWLEILFEHGDMLRRLVLLDVIHAYGEACRPLLRLLPPSEAPNRDQAIERVRSLTLELVTRAQEQEALRPGTRHRALPDAESLWRTWRSVGELVTESLAKEAGP